MTYVLIFLGLVAALPASIYGALVLCTSIARAELRRRARLTALKSQ